jgi:hypothetical protein
MRYVDVCSLYPYVLKYKPFPIGHPQIITSDFEDVNQYFGLIRCHVFPPRGLYHPVLPYKTGGKLLFPLNAVPVQNTVTWDPTIVARTPMPNAV